jgi:hypothetical protein
MAEAQVERDLIEYFVDRRGALEPPSNFGSMAAALEVQRGSSGCETDCSARSSCSCSDATWRVHQISQTGQRGLAARIGATEMDERRLKLLDDEYPVRRALAAVGERIAEVLEVGCSCSVLGLEAFGQRAALAPLTRAARAAWIASSTSRDFGEWIVRCSWRVRKSKGGATAADRLLAAQITREAQGLWREALAAYCEALARFGDLVRARQQRARAESRARVEAVEAEQARRS